MRKWFHDKKRELGFKQKSTDFFFSVLRFELRVSGLLSRHSATWSHISSPTDLNNEGLKNMSSVLCPLV
jgi:hypothetical protein